MNIRKPTLVDLILLCSNARQDEIEQHEAIIDPVWEPQRVAADLYNRIGHKFVLYDEGELPIVAGGWDPIFDGVWSGWLVGSEAAWGVHALSITRACRNIMDSLIQSDGARRLCINGLASRTAACDWYERGLQMTREGTMRAFGRNGEDLALYARVKESFNGPQ